MSRSVFNSALCRWESQSNLNQHVFFDYDTHHSEHQQHFNDCSQPNMALEYTDSMGSKTHKQVDSGATYSYQYLERKETMAFPTSYAKATDQFVFTDFELPSSSDGGASGEYMKGRAGRFDRRASLLSNNMPVSLPESSILYDSGGSSVSIHPQSTNYKDAYPSCTADPGTSSCFRNDCISSITDNCLEEEEEYRMSRVDWRWAALKGFWDKDKKCWIESAGGQAAYIQQRMQRVQVRKQRLARQAKAMQRLVPAQNLPFRSGLVEELPYHLDDDPWAAGIQSTDDNKSRIAPESKASAPSWFDRSSDNGGGRAAGVSMQLFPFSRSAEPLQMGSGSLWQQQQSAEAASSVPAPKWYDAAYAPAASPPSAPQGWWGAVEESRHSGNPTHPDAAHKLSAPRLCVGSWW